MMEKYKILILAVIVIVGLGASEYFFQIGPKISTLSSQEVGDKIKAFIENDILQGAGIVSLNSIVDEGSIYKLNMTIDGQDYESFATKDGNYLFPEGYSLVGADSAEIGIEKRDMPDVKLFIMSYCPFGLQAQKMYLPVYDLLKDKVNMGIYFVDYIMHEKKEIDENLNQYCIQKEQADKFPSFLDCFIKGTDSKACMSSVGVDTTKLQSCVLATDSQFGITSLYEDKSTWLGGYYPQFNIQKDLNELYGVQGSPTIVINDKATQLNLRSPEAFKELICQAFNEQPEECSQTLSSSVPSTGFGAGEDTSPAAGTCE
ncbi:MAG: hypothetical protein ABH831_00845 [Candidatus Nealsonbacteria bacterium]